MSSFHQESEYFKKDIDVKFSDNMSFIKPK